MPTHAADRRLPAPDCLARIITGDLVAPTLREFYAFPACGNDERGFVLRYVSGARRMFLRLHDTAHRAPGRWPDAIGIAAILRMQHGRDKATGSALAVSLSPAYAL